MNTYDSPIYDLIDDEEAAILWCEGIPLMTWDDFLEVEDA